jgi:hypothetical protein
MTLSDFELVTHKGKDIIRLLLARGYNGKGSILMSDIELLTGVQLLVKRWFERKIKRLIEGMSWCDDTVI